MSTELLKIPGAATTDTVGHLIYAAERPAKAETDALYARRCAVLCAKGGTRKN